MTPARLRTVDWPAHPLDHRDMVQEVSGLESQGFSLGANGRSPSPWSVPGASPWGGAGPGAQAGPQATCCGGEPIWLNPTVTGRSCTPTSGQAPDPGEQMGSPSWGAHSPETEFTVPRAVAWGREGRPAPQAHLQPEATESGGGDRTLLSALSRQSQDHGVGPASPASREDPTTWRRHVRRTAWWPRVLGPAWTASLGAQVPGEQPEEDGIRCCPRPAGPGQPEEVAEVAGSAARVTWLRSCSSSCPANWRSSRFRRSSSPACRSRLFVVT